MLGMYCNTLISLTASGPHQILESWLPYRATVVYLQDMYVTEAGFGPGSVLAWWVKNADGSGQVRGVMTNLPATWQPPHVDRNGVSRLAERGFHLIDAARNLGYTSIRFDTSIQQNEAKGLYQCLGFQVIQPYYELPEELRKWLAFMELRL